MSSDVLLLPPLCLHAKLGRELCFSFNLFLLGFLCKGKVTLYVVTSAYKLLSAHISHFPFNSDYIYVKFSGNFRFQPYGFLTKSTVYTKPYLNSSFKSEFFKQILVLFDVNDVYPVFADHPEF